MGNKTLLVIYEKSTGNIAGTNSTGGATFENVYPDVSIEFKEKYDGIVVDYDKDIENNPTKYKVENGTVTIRDTSLVVKQNKPSKIEQRLSDVEMSFAALLLAVKELQQLLIRKGETLKNVL